MTGAAKVPVLLVLNGAVLAAHTLLAKQASGVGVAPLLYALASALVAGLALGAARRGRPVGRRFDRTVVIYGLVAGLISIALPQVLIYSASAYVGAGVASLAYAFPTPLTFVLAALFGVERASLGRSVGIAVAFAGAVLLALSRSASLAGEAFWTALALLAPVAIASGNIYRARFWPAGAAPLDLATAMSAGAALWLALAIVLAGAPGTFAAVGPEGWWYLGLAGLLATGGNLIYFELQRSGGIVSFSQIGYVAAVLGLLGGFAVLGEAYDGTTWLAAGIIALGVALSELMKRRAAEG